jgi:hypothetical protein
MVELEFLLMALGHNFRKMSMKSTNCSNSVDKALKSRPKNNICTKNYSFLKYENYFSLNSNSNSIISMLAA